jgi:hypothetical protein
MKEENKMAGTKKVMRTEIESGVIISTVMFTDTGVYETMAFNNADDMDEIDCAETDVYANALEHHMMMVHKFIADTAETDETTEEQPTSFVVGGVYETPSICNSDCIFSYRVEKVTAKTVVIADKFGKTKRCKIHNDGSVPYIFPEGQYSMCPIIEATDIVR